MPLRKRTKGRARKGSKGESSGRDQQWSGPQPCLRGKGGPVPPADDRQTEGKLRDECDRAPPAALASARPTFESAPGGRAPGPRRRCRHGPDSDPPADECLPFEVALEDETERRIGDGRSVIESLIRAFGIADARRPGVLDDRGSRESIREVHLASGAESVLSWATGPNERVRSIYCAGVVIFLEEYEGFDFKACCIKLKMRLDDVFGGGERGATAFFSRRIPCRCLDDKKRTLKAEPKTSICCVCHEWKDCKTLRRCGSCNIVQYCSRECQKADWPAHKGDCDRLNFWMKKGIRSETPPGTQQQL